MRQQSCSLEYPRMNNWRKIFICICRLFCSRTIHRHWRPPRCSYCNNFKLQRVQRHPLQRVLARAPSRMSNINYSCNNTSASAQRRLRTQRRPRSLAHRKSTLRISRAWPPWRRWVTPPVSMVGVHLFYFSVHSPFVHFDPYFFIAYWISYSFPSYLNLRLYTIYSIFIHY